MARTINRAFDQGAILELARGASRAEASRRSGMSTRTLTRRLLDPTFRAGIEKRRRELAERIGAKLIEAAVQAVDTLRKELNNEDPGIRVSASKAILSHLVQFRGIGLLEKEFHLKEELATGGDEMISQMPEQALARFIKNGAKIRGLDLSAVPADVLKSTLREINTNVIDQKTVKDTSFHSSDMERKEVK